MGLKKLARKLERLVSGTDKHGLPAIEPEDVEDILQKLHAKHRKLQDELAHADDEQVADRIRRKLAIVEEQKERGEELLSAVRGEGR